MNSIDVLFVLNAEGLALQQSSALSVTRQLELIK